MASNELAAILARRRAKDGSGNANDPVATSNALSSASSSAAATATATTAASKESVAKPVSRSSIAERIAKLQQGGDSQKTVIVPPLQPIPINRIPSKQVVLENTVAGSLGEAPTANKSEVSSSDTLFPSMGNSDSSSSDPSSADMADSAGSGNQKTSDRIKQLQGSLGGFGVNPFRPG